MIEKNKKQRKGSICEQDISTIFQKYNAIQVLALLQEVAQVQDVKIDWNELVRKTTTGISNPREYQMLWRHLAYRGALLERLEDGAKPLDDDSDLEYELEAFPTVSSEALTEAAACVKVMIASGLPGDSNLMNGLTVEAPLTINIPNIQLSKASSENLPRASAMKGTNITVPVSVQKQQLPTVTSTEGLDANGAATSSNLPRRKRKPWTREEDDELIAAVEKMGEGNWANILKGDFKGDRTASQLSQRWTIIRKRKGSMNGGSQEAISATRHAVSLALNMPPIGDKLKAASLNAGTAPNITPSISAHPTVAEISSAGPHARNQTQPDPIHTTAQRVGPTGSSSRLRVAPKKQLSKPAAATPDSGVHLAAVAAGARIASPSDAASLLKAAQGKKTIHIIPGSGSKISSSNPLPNPHLGSHPNVHFLRTGVTPTPPSTYSTVPLSASRPHLGPGNTLKACTSTVQAQICSTGSDSNPTSDTAFVPLNIPEVKTTEDIIPGSSKDLQENKAASEEKVDLLPNEKAELIQENQASPKCENDQKVETEHSYGGHKIDLPINNGDVNQPAPMEIYEERKVNVKEEDSMPMIVDGGDEIIEIKVKVVAGTETGDMEKQTI